MEKLTKEQQELVYNIVHRNQIEVDKLIEKLQKEKDCK